MSQQTDNESRTTVLAKEAAMIIFKALGCDLSAIHHRESKALNEPKVFPLVKHIQVTMVWNTSATASTAFSHLIVDVRLTKATEILPWEVDKAVFMVNADLMSPLIYENVTDKLWQAAEVEKTQFFGIEIHKIPTVDWLGINVGVVCPILGVTSQTRYLIDWGMANNPLLGGSISRLPDFGENLTADYLALLSRQPEYHRHIQAMAHLAGLPTEVVRAISPAVTSFYTNPLAHTTFPTLPTD